MAEKSFLYLKLYDTLKSEIESGVLLPGNKLPGEEELRARFHVSAITIKKGLSMLAEDGFVRRVPGRGTFVRGTQPEAAVAAPRRTRNPQLIGLVLEHVSTPFGLEMLYEMDRALSEHGYKLCVRYSYTDRDRETEEMRFLQSLGVAGLLVMPCHGNFYNPALLRLILDEFPIVLVDKQLEGIPVPSVRTDNAGAVRTLVRHLYERGCRRIGLVSLEAADTTSLVERAQGFEEECARLGLPACPPCLVQMTKDVIENGPDPGITATMRAYLAAHGHEVDSLVCTEYGIISCLMRAAEDTGVALGPDGLRVCCVDEDYLAPGGYTFTHMRQDERAIAYRAVELLLARLAGEQPEHEDVIIPAQFCQGKTT